MVREMQSVAGADPPPARARRRGRWLVAAVMAAILLCFVALQLARIAAQRALESALGTPVTVGALWWTPWNGRLSVERISLGSGSEQITARRVSAVVNPFHISREAITLGRVEVEGPAGPVHVDDHLRVTVGALGRGTGRGGAAPPQIAIGELVVTDGTVAVQYPVRDALQTSQLGVTRFAATDVALTPSPRGARVSMTGEFTGTINGSPVGGTLRLTIAGADTRIAGTLDVSRLAINGTLLPLPAELESLTATVNARARIEMGGEPAAPQIHADAELAGVQFSGAEGSRVSVEKAVVHNLRISPADKSVDLGTVTLNDPTLPITATDSALVLPVPSAGESGARSAWSVSSGAFDVRGGTIRVQRGEAAVSFALDTGRWDGLHGDRPSGLGATLRADGGGSLVVAGTITTAPAAAQLTVRLADVDLPSMAPLAPPLPVALAKGTADGELRIRTAHGRLQRLDGELHARSVHTVPPDPAFPREVMAAHTADLEFTVSGSAPLQVAIQSMRLSYPYVLVQRRDAGIFPYLLFTNTGTTGTSPPAAATDGATGAPVRFRIHHLEAENGRLEFLDSTLTPPYWSSFADVQAQADEIRIPDGTAEHFKITGKQDELSPTVISGALTERGLDARFEMTDVLLPAMNSYIAPILGYRIVSGRLSISATAEPVPPVLESNAEIVLSGVDLLQTGVDVIREQSGVPLPIALELIANPAGEIRLTLPLTVNPSSRSVSIGSVVWQAIRSAIVGSLSTPLRLLGSLFGTEGAPHAFAVDPIPFPIGGGSLDDAGRLRVTQVARILQAHGTLAVVLMPQLTREDLDKVGTAHGPQLAAARLDAVRQALTKGGPDHAGIAAERLLPVTWTPEVGAAATSRPSVYLELQEGVAH